MTEYAHNHFINKHIGTLNLAHQQAMLQTIGVESLAELIEQTIPETIALKNPLSKISPALTEYAYLQHIQAVAQKNEVWQSYIGLGYYNAITPSPILRTIFENPGWYTQYTPYQAEIAQGRLEALLNFQTMVSDLTGLPIANASLLDEATAAAEAMQMLHREHNKTVRNNTDFANVFLADQNCLPTTLQVLHTRAEAMNITLIVEDFKNFDFTKQTFGCIVSYPNQLGEINDYQGFTEKAHQNNCKVIVATDLMSLALLTPPAEWGADVAIGNSQRFGIPLGFGGPHAAFFATTQEFMRQVPGRIMGVSIDRNNQPAYRMTLQTREQHIKREKATSNICTAQALLAIMAGMYAVYHGQEGIKFIANKIHHLTTILEKKLIELGYAQLNTSYFDTLLLDLSANENASVRRIKRIAELEKINFRYFENNPELIGISIDETCTYQTIEQIANIFSEAINNQTIEKINPENEKNIQPKIPATLTRKSDFLTHPVFNTYHTETELIRYIRHLENKDLSLLNAMIPLGSCTMKLNAATQLIPVSYPQFANIHPFVPADQTKGYNLIINELEQFLCHITGFTACSLQPNSGAQGEYAGLLVIRAYHHYHQQPNRTVALIPASAHGTNPASAIMAGMKVVIVNCDENGNIDTNDLTQKAKQYAEQLSCLMVTYPSTHGVFETQIQEICHIIHQCGGLVYMDGANMNAQVGLTQPAIIGADVCHINLHKTFSIPHGGGGPGMGPICVNDKLAPFLPSHIYRAVNPSPQAISAVSAAPYSSASILLISYAYIKMLGNSGVTDATRYAILNANYIKARLQKHYNILYVGKNGKVAHELIIDVRPFKATADIEAEDVAKRLIDYGFHAPTVAFPVPGTLMIEPTESESKAEIDRFCEALISIRSEIEAIENGNADKIHNVLKNAPHTLLEVTADTWLHPYTRAAAAYPLPYLKARKFWASVARINNSHGDRNIVCTCPPIEAYN